MSRYNGIGGIFFGTLSMIIGIYKIIYTIKVKSLEKQKETIDTKQIK